MPNWFSFAIGFGDDILAEIVDVRFWRTWQAKPMSPSDNILDIFNALSTVSKREKTFFPNEIQTNHRKSIIIIFVWKSNWLRHKVAHFVLSSFFKSFGRIQYVPRLSSKTYTKLWVRAFGKVKIYTSMSIKMKMMLCYIAPEANQFSLKLMRFKVHAKSSTK